MEFKDIKSIVDLMKKNDLSEFEMEKEGFKIKLRRPSGEGKSDEVQVQHYLPPAAPAPAEPPDSMCPRTRAMWRWKDDVPRSGATSPTR